LVGWLEH